MIQHRSFDRTSQFSLEKFLSTCPASLRITSALQKMVRVELILDEAANGLPEATRRLDIPIKIPAAIDLPPVPREAVVETSLRSDCGFVCHVR